MTVDELKRRTGKSYTAWDLNVPRLYHPKWRKKLGMKFKRGARRAMKQELREEFKK